MEPRVTDGGERYGRQRDTERKRGIGVGRGGREWEGGREREGGRGPQLAGAEPEREKRREKFPGVFIS